MSVIVSIITHFYELMYTFILDICPEVVILGHRVHICSNVLDSAKQFPKGVALIGPPTNCVGELLLPHIFATVLYHLTFLL